MLRLSDHSLFTSSRRFKEEIKPMEQASEAIYSLKPVSFRYKTQIEPTRPLSFGLIAEDVEEINADLVLRGKDGKASSVRYEAVNAMLLNEFLKEHKKVQELEKGMATLTAQFKEQQCNSRKRARSSRPVWPPDASPIGIDLHQRPNYKPKTTRNHNYGN